MRSENKKYKKLEEGRTAYFDVDHTLILWEMDPKQLIPYPGTIWEDDYKTFEKLISDQPESLLMQKNGHAFIVRPIWTHVLQLVQQKMKGVKVVVWSASGSDWAEAVVNRLLLDDFVDIILTKPDFTYDDSKPDGWLGRQFYFAWDEVNQKMGRFKQSKSE